MAFFQEYRKELKKVKEQLNETSEENKVEDTQFILDSDSNKKPDIFDSMTDSENAEFPKSESEVNSAEDSEALALQEKDLIITDESEVSLTENSERLFSENDDSILVDDTTADKNTLPDDVTAADNDVILDKDMDFSRNEAIDVYETAVPITKENCSHITKGTRILGSIISSDDIIIEGTVDGDITCEKDVSIHGILHGDTKAASVTASCRRLEGSITCTGDARIKSTCVMIGEIKADSLHLEGAVKGNITITNEAVMTSSAVFKGDLCAASLKQEYGALAEGKFMIGQHPDIK